MSNLKFITEPWVDFPEGETEALYLDVDRQYTISEFIAFNDYIGQMLLSHFQTF